MGGSLSLICRPEREAKYGMEEEASLQTWELLWLSVTSSLCSVHPAQRLQTRNRTWKHHSRNWTYRLQAYAHPPQLVPSSAHSWLIADKEMLSHCLKETTNIGSRAIIFLPPLPPSFYRPLLLLFHVAEKSIPPANVSYERERGVWLLARELNSDLFIVFRLSSVTNWRAQCVQ